MNHVLVAPDKFKGSLTAPEVAAHVAAGLRRARPGLDVREVPVADGGDGTLHAAVAAGFRRVPVRATGPLGDPVDTAYAERDGVTVVELADASGLGRLPAGVRAPLHATSAGTGDVIRSALDAGCHTVVLGLGGSACTDGGAGMLRALGVRFLDADGRDVAAGGGGLLALAEVDVSGLHPAVRDTEFVVASDVDNSLLGPHGAAAVYGPQKGAGPQDVRVLNVGLVQLVQLLERDAGVSPALADRPGAGAAGGVGFAALALGATVRPGIDYLLDLTGFHRHLPGAALVITGEGSLDLQTLRGKAPAGVAAAARDAGVPVVAVAGRCALTGLQLVDAGFAGAYALSDVEPDAARAISHAGVLLERVAAERLTDHLGRQLTATTTGGTR